LFDDLEEVTGLGEDAHREFFHDFCSGVQYELFDKDGNSHWVKIPYLICDGGYNKYRSMQCPWKWSRWVCPLHDTNITVRW
jgi:hypothetical protein